jgi:hypothetical protein
MDSITKMLEEIDIGEMSGHIQWMIKNTPYRIAGGEDERRAAQYVTSRMKEYGLEAEVFSFNAYNSYPEYSDFEVLSPVRMRMDSLPCGHIESTDKNGVELDLVYVASGGYGDYADRDVKGKAVLVEVSYAPAVPEKARIAYEKGAAAIVCMNWGSGQDVICHRALKSVWGNPTEATLGNIPRLVGVGITQNDGIKLRELCKGPRPVRVRIAAIAKAGWSQVRQPRGILRGNGESEEFVLVGSHLDAWRPGVTCNATGNATTLQIAKLLARQRESLRRDLWFVFWTGHEIAEAAGSTWLADNFWDELNKKCVAYVNIDSTGLGEATVYEIKTAEEYASFSVSNAEEYLTESIRTQRLTKIGDQSFMGIGIPGIAQRMSYTEEYMKRNSGATLGWWNHTKEDGYDKYSPENIGKDAKVLTSLIYRLACIDILPYDYTKKLADIEMNIERINGEYGEYIPMDDVKRNIAAARVGVASIQALKGRLEGEKKKKYNKYMLLLSRLLTNVFQTYADKYQQDSYGYSKLASPIPLLADLSRLKQMDPRSLEYGMVETQLVKNKNRINDALNMIVELSSVYGEVLRGD